MIDAIANWAHKVHVKPSKLKPKDATAQADAAMARWIEKPTKMEVLKDDVVVIRNGKDLAKSKIAAVPQDRKAMAELERKVTQIAPCDRRTARHCRQRQLCPLPQRAG